MKLVKTLYGTLALACAALSSCDINEAPEFSDSDAFVAFTNSSMSIGEDQGSIEIPVMLASFGLEAECTVTVDTENSTAVEGKNFTIDEGSKTLKFTKDAPTQYVKVNIIDNDTFDGNVSLSLGLAAQGVNVGANKTCQLTITDNEHPLLFILGTYSASADSYFSSRGHFDWDITISRDDEDINKVWVGNLEPYFAANGFVAPSKNNFYGVVNSDKTEIRIPVGQKIGYQDSGVDVLLAGFSGADPDESAELKTGENIIISIKDNGKTLVVENAFGAASDGWWNLMYGNLTITKK